MIYNQEFNFLFVHIQKTAGTSITESLLQCPGSKFIVPPHVRLCDVAILGKRPQVVAVVRNPWERLASWWFMMNRKGVHNDFSAYLLAPGPDESPVDFSAFIRRTDVIRETSDEFPVVKPQNVRKKWFRPYLKSLGWNQVDYLTRRGRVAADAVLRFEQLDRDWERVMWPILGPALPELLRLNQSAEGNRLNWRRLYEDSRDVDFVAQQYRRDLDMWGFTFPDSP